MHPKLINMNYIEIQSLSVYNKLTLLNEFTQGYVNVIEIFTIPLCKSKNIYSHSGQGKISLSAKKLAM